MLDCSNSLSQRKCHLLTKYCELLLDGHIKGRSEKLQNHRKISFRVEIGSQGAAAGFWRWEDTSEGRSTRIPVIWDEGWLQLIQKLSIAPRCTIVWYGFIFCFWFSLNICFLAQRVVAWGNWSRTTYVAIPPPRPLLPNRTFADYTPFW